MNLKGSGRKWYWPDGGNISTFAGEMVGNRKYLRMDYAPSEIRISVTSTQQHYRQVTK
jgi:hypothetical protein